ncbi:MAG: hypothetical protein JNG85_11435 [Spirochaetaceae bacterium]|nr:hypothetical protein [Spirochaetaceae bacterium]
MGEEETDKSPRAGMSDTMRYALFIALGVFNLFYSARILTGQAMGVAGWLSTGIGVSLVAAGILLLVRERRRKARASSPKDRSKD